MNEVLPLVSRWLHECRTTHLQCKSENNPFNPSRLVSTEKNRVRLLLRQEIQGTPDYATLSHCWGQTKFITLNKHNLDQFRRAIPDEALSRSFIDAIVIARELGLLYTWIDSLCILQDDKED